MSNFPPGWNLERARAAEILASAAEGVGPDALADLADGQLVVGVHRPIVLDLKLASG